MTVNLKIPKTSLEVVIKNWKFEEKKVLADIAKKVRLATQIVWAAARTRRSSISVAGSDKKGTAVYSKNKKVVRGFGKLRTVSDPFSPFGVPVKTGRLRASIERDVKEGAYRVRGIVEAKEKYAHWLEFGTSKMRARPFMRPALMLQAKQIRELFARKTNA